MSSRKGTRTNFKHFPEEYFTVIERLASGIETFLGPFPWKEAKALQADLYRFAGFLRDAYNTDPYASQLSDTCRSWSLYTIKVPDTDPPLYHVHVRLNPLVKSIRDQSTTGFTTASDIKEPRH